MTRRRRNVWVPRQRRHSVVCHADASGIVITNTVNVMRRIRMKTKSPIWMNLKTRSSWFNCVWRGDEADNWCHWVSRGHLCLLYRTDVTDPLPLNWRYYVLWKELFATARGQARCNTNSWNINESACPKYCNLVFPNFKKHVSEYPSRIS